MYKPNRKYITQNRLWLFPIDYNTIYYYTSYRVFCLKSNNK